jgi:hypothetical protein
VRLILSHVLLPPSPIMGPISALRGDDAGFGMGALDRCRVLGLQVTAYAAER